MNSTSQNQFNNTAILLEQVVWHILAKAPLLHPNPYNYDYLKSFQMIVVFTDSDRGQWYFYTVPEYAESTAFLVWALWKWQSPVVHQIERLDHCMSLHQILVPVHNSCLAVWVSEYFLREVERLLILLIETVVQYHWEYRPLYSCSYRSLFFWVWHACLLYLPCLYRVTPVRLLHITE